MNKSKSKYKGPERRRYLRYEAGPNRRKYMRLESDCVINYVRLSKELKPMYDIVEDSYSQNISANGMKFISNESLQLGGILELQIKIPTIKNFITAIGKVVRMEKTANNRYEAALTFVWIKEKDAKAINDYVKKKELIRIQSEIKY